MLTHGDRVKVLDFGVARMTRLLGPEDVTVGAPTAPGAVIGTLRYMSPEQARGEEPDARGDIFSFGILLYELLVGQHPFAGPDVRDTLAAILTQEPRPIPPNSPVLVELRAIVWKCLEKDKTRHCQTKIQPSATSDILRWERSTP